MWSEEAFGGDAGAPDEGLTAAIGGLLLFPRHLEELEGRGEAAEVDARVALHVRDIALGRSRACGARAARP
jgi:hypothetical protein